MGDLGDERRRIGRTSADEALASRAPLAFLLKASHSCLRLGTLWEAMTKPSVEVLRGTLDLLVLKAVSWGPAHGYAVARWIEQATDDVLRIEEGSLYPALHRLETRGWVAADWGT